MHMSGYQGHGSVATPHGVLITWALMMEGGIQVNEQGLRFSNENQGYSEQSVHVLAQSNKVAWVIYDEKLHLLGKEFPDYLKAINSGAIKSAENAASLIELIGVDRKGFEETLRLIEDFSLSKKVDPFGREFKRNLAPSEKMYAIKVTGALFHTQGGLLVNEKAQVLKSDNTPFKNLFAGGGAACGVSGPDVSGYLSGNGLLTAFSLGGLAGWNASK
jgi:fumarate reductase flavoprotein subunit